MFTGIIEAVCEVKSATGVQLTVDLGGLAEDVKIGESIAVNGVCLTVSKLSGNIVTFDLSEETLAKSSLSKCAVGVMVNIERAMKPTDRMGGHFVLGHVDGTGKIKKIENKGKFADISFSVDKQLMEQMIVKGSVAVDGISLTIAQLNGDSFSVAIIPQTLEKTNLGKCKVGDVVNIETDIIVKTIKRHLESILPAKGGLTMEKLREVGF